jgi:hypothetical protein
MDMDVTPAGTTNVPGVALLKLAMKGLEETAKAAVGIAI